MVGRVGAFPGKDIFSNIKYAAKSMAKAISILFLVFIDMVNNV